jgi:hypothetical protein
MGKMLPLCAFCLEGGLNHLGNVKNKKSGNAGFINNSFPKSTEGQT